MPGYWEKTLCRNFNEHDWETHSGAEAWSEDDPPLWRDLPFGFAIADKNGIEITAMFNDAVYRLNMEFTANLAMLIINSLYFGEQTNPHHDLINTWLTQYGFVKIA